MGRSPCCEKVGLKKGPWTPEEDQKLLAHIEKHGHGSWRALPIKAGLQRCGKSCRLRWTNYLRPDIKRGKFSLQEEHTIIQLHALLGNRWSAIATHLPKRTDNEIKNYWNTHLKKRLAKMGIDPVTHKPKSDTLGCQSKSAASLSHMAQWESARLEAEARLARESKFRSVSTSLHHHNSLSLGSTSSSSSSCSSSATPLDHDVLQAWAFSGVGLIEDNHSTICHNMESEEVEWKCLFGKPRQIDNFTSLIISVDSSNIGTVSSDAGDELDVVGFTGMLLGNSSDNAEERSSCAEEDEESKQYWDSILNLVNSDSPSNSPQMPPPLF